MIFLVRSQKDNLKMAEAAEEQRLLRVQKNYIELEMRKFKRKKICFLHDLENQLLRDVSFTLGDAYMWTNKQNFSIFQGTQ